MQLTELSSLDKDSYNRFVAESRGGSFLQSWEWGEWQVHLGRTVYRFKILDDSGEWAGSVQLIKMPLPLGKYYLYAPYGPVVDLRFKIEDFRFLLQELRKKLPDTIFIRIEPKESFNFQLLTFNLPIVKSTNIQPGKTLLIDLSKTEEQLLGDMHHKTRYNIKVAQKHGVEIKDEFAISIGHGLFFDEALKLIIETSKRQQFATFPPSYYKKMIDFFALGKPREVRLHIYKAIFDSRLLAAAIMIDFGKTRTFLFGGSADEHRNVMAPYLLHWQAIQDAKASGIEVYDFWGTETSSGEVPGFVRFKLGFAPQLRSGSLSGSEQSYAGAYDFIISKLWYRAYGLLRLVNKMLKKISPK